MEERKAWTGERAFEFTVVGHGLLDVIFARALSLAINKRISVK